MRPPPQASERDALADAIRAVRAGDVQAFASVVAAFQQRIFGLALMMTHDRAGAEDVMQETFVRAYTRLGRYDQRREFYPWLTTIAVRLAQNWLKRYRRMTVPDRTEAAPATDTATTPELLADLIDDERARRLWRAVASLPRAERIAVFLHYRDDMPVADVATALGVTTGTVKTSLFRARGKLRRLMSEATAPQTEPQEVRR